MQRIYLDQIKPSSHQPRKVFTQIEKLAASIKEKGLIHPIMIRGTSLEGKHGYTGCIKTTEVTMCYLLA